MATAQDYGLGEFRFPRGWFMVGQASDATRKPTAMRYFGEEFVMYRGENDKVYVVEAYCPHMGSHFGHNETSYIVKDDEQIEGDGIRCPYHGWKFSGETGECTDIPYSPAPIPKAACIKTMPATEWGGLVFVWYDPEGGEPDYDLPDISQQWGQPDWVDWKVDYMGQIDLHPIEALDNMVDKAHFIPIHGSMNLQKFENEFEDHIVRQIFSAGHKTLSDDILDTYTWYTGPGLLMSKMEGFYNSILFIANTQVDEGVTKVWHGLMVQVPKAPPSEEDLGAVAAYQQASHDAFNQDFDVWKHKRPAIQPLQVIGDGPFGKLRQWASQFYNPRDKAKKIQASINGRYVTKGTAQAPWPDKVEAAE